MREFFSKPKAKTKLLEFMCGRLFTILLRGDILELYYFTKEQGNEFGKIRQVGRFVARYGQEK
jgi:hypothetical protein